MVFGHFISTLPPKSHGALIIRIDCVHVFGQQFMRSIAKRVQHVYSPKNYPIDDEAGKIYIDMITELVRPFMMYSPAHAATNTM